MSLPPPVSNAAWIPLTKGKFALIDLEDFERASKHSWCYPPIGYPQTRIKGKAYLLHKFILNFPNQMVDHINRDKLDNRKMNLRLCNHQGNNANGKMDRRNKSGYRGVSWSKSKNKWRTTISVNNHQLFLGYFENVIKAAEAYDEAASKHFGEFASLNFY